MDFLKSKTTLYGRKWRATNGEHMDDLKSEAFELIIQFNVYFQHRCTHELATRKLFAVSVDEQLGGAPFRALAYSLQPTEEDKFPLCRARSANSPAEAAI